MSRPLARLMCTIWTEASIRWTSTLWYLQAFGRWVTGSHGAFRDPAQTAEARELTAAWESTWPGSEPRGFLIREHRDRSVRFHSLPGSKRYADNAEEYAEILRRHHAVITSISNDAPTEDLVVIAADWGPRDLVSGWSRRRLPAAWPWRQFHDAENDGITTYFWVASGLSSPDLDDLLTAVADYEGHAIVTDTRTSWLYCPYDGGADVVLPSALARDALRDQFPDWLPAAC
ncbi:hypothetical protein ACFU7D_10715 [Nocardioides sp. NPDC057577]|uniref:DUF3885 domain-containing protein n=1 Tax=Nocardioides sp. NPDC057577 TaxID=3346171 RepID=UPI00366C61DE